MFNWGRVYFLQQFGAMIHELIDLCGRSALLFPTEAQWYDPGRDESLPATLVRGGPRRVRSPGSD